MQQSVPMLVRRIDGVAVVAMLITMSLVVVAASCSLSPFFGPDDCPPGELQALPEDVGSAWVGVMSGETPNADQVVAFDETGSVVVASASVDVGEFAIEQARVDGDPHGSDVLIFARCGGGLPRDTGAPQIHVLDVRAGTHRQLTSTADRHVAGSWSNDGSRYAYLRTELQRGRTLVVTDPTVPGAKFDVLASDLELASVVGWSDSDQAVLVTVRSGTAADVIMVAIDDGEIEPIMDGTGLGVVGNNRLIVHQPAVGIVAVDLRDRSTSTIVEQPGMTELTAVVDPAGGALVFASTGESGTPGGLQRLVFDNDGRFQQAEEMMVMPADRSAFTSRAVPVSWPTTDQLVIARSNGVTDGGGSELVVVDPGRGGAIVVELPFVADRGVAWLAAPE